MCSPLKNNPTSWRRYRVLLLEATVAHPPLLGSLFGLAGAAWEWVSSSIEAVSSGIYAAAIALVATSLWQATPPPDLASTLLSDTTTKLRSIMNTWATAVESDCLGKWVLFQCEHL